MKTPVKESWIRIQRIIGCFQVITTFRKSHLRKVEILLGTCRIFSRFKKMQLTNIINTIIM